jgi:hypothetical protein
MTETEKWRDPWFRNLAPEQKLMFLFIVDQCNLGGFYEIDVPYMSFCTGLSESAIEGAIKGLSRGCIQEDGWIWVKNFLRHQRNENINPDNRAHMNIISCVNEQLNRFSLVPDFQEFLGAFKGLLSPYGKGKGKGKGQARETENLADQLPDDLFKIPFMLEAWQDWTQHRKEIKKPLTPTAVKQQYEQLRKSSDPVATIRNSIAAGYQGLFEPKTNGKPKQTSGSIYAQFEGTDRST